MPVAVAEDLKKLSAAEDFFRYLEVDFDPLVLNRARLHILRRLAESLHRTPLDGVDDDGSRALFRSALEGAYADFVTSSPIKERVFKVHKDARRALLPFARRR
jgi:nitrogenase-stabilizing/protective protein